MDNFKR
jgi:elongation factor 1-gamma